MVNDQDFKSDDKWTKLIVIILVFFGVTTLFLGILKINKSISGDTFSMSVDQNIDENTDNTKTIKQLMDTDTDGDGLSDYQEMYVYGTSIYLTDTDSDGYSDKDEVDKGYDPNCPKGTDCRGTDSTANVPTLNDINQNNNQLSSEDKAKLENLSADQVRQLLLSSGQISKEDLAKISDEDLMDIFKKSLNQQ